MIAMLSIYKKTNCYLTADDMAFIVSWKVPVGAV